MAVKRSVDKGLGFVKDVTDERTPGPRPRGLLAGGRRLRGQLVPVLKAQADGAGPDPGRRRLSPVRIGLLTGEATARA